MRDRYPNIGAGRWSVLVVERLPAAWVPLFGRPAAVEAESRQHRLQGGALVGSVA